MRTLSASLLAATFTAFAALAGCGDDSGGGGGAGGGDDAGVGGSHDTGGGSGVGGEANADCAAFVPGGDMLSVDWGLGDDDARFAAFAQAAGDVRVASRAFLTSVALGCFDLASALGASPPDPGAAPTSDEVVAVCDTAEQTYASWVSGRQAVIEIDPAECAIGATDPQCVALCDGDDGCLPYCEASAQAKQTCSATSAELMIDQGPNEDEAVLAAASLAIEEVADAQARIELLIDAVTLAINVPAVTPPPCTPTVVQAVAESQQDTEAAASANVSLLAVLSSG